MPQDDDVIKMYGNLNENADKIFIKSGEITDIIIIIYFLVDILSSNQNQALLNGLIFLTQYFDALSSLQMI